MTNRLIRASALALGAIVLSTAFAVADDGPVREPANPIPTIACHASIDPGFIATIKDQSNDTGFIAAFDDISNDSGFLVPVDPVTGGDSPVECPTILPLLEPGQP